MTKAKSVKRGGGSRGRQVCDRARSIRVRGCPVEEMEAELHAGLDSARGIAKKIWSIKDGAPRDIRSPFECLRPGSDSNRWSSAFLGKRNSS